MLPATRTRLFWLSLFALAMAQLEATVVVYLRELFYPEGFAFPLVIVEGRIAAVEIGREAATLVMLVAIGVLAHRDAWRRYAAFLWTFGLWDVFYYLWLFVLDRGWPPSLLTWDVLFLIPLPWLGPVLAPVLIALVMMAAGVTIEVLRDRERPIRVRAWEWAVTVGVALALITLFCWDWRAVVDGRMPGPFPWIPFLVLLAGATAVAVRVALRSFRASPEPL